MKPDEDDPSCQGGNEEDGIAQDVQRCRMVYENPNFCTLYFGGQEPNPEKLLKIWYYAITTLSTIGYGDMFPISPYEQLGACFILLCGVTVFSFVMG